MKKKQTVRLIVSGLLTLVMFAGTWQAAFAAYVDDNEISHGRAGVFVPAGINTNNLIATSMAKEDVHGAPIRFRKLLNLEFLNAEGGTSSFPTSFTYVFFVLSKSEVRDWQNGDLNIYYRNPDGQGWTACPNTFIVQEGETAEDQTQDTTLSTGSTRIACLAPVYSVYGLGTSRSSN